MTDTLVQNPAAGQVPIIAKLDDIDRHRAEAAFSNTSFDPERRGEARRNEYVEAVNGLYAELWSMATSGEQRGLLDIEMERYRQGYLARMNAFLSSHARVASAMITGPARFPTARNEKRSRWADNKAEELYTWEKRARESIKRKLLDSRPAEEKADEEWQRVKLRTADSLTSGNTLIYSNLAGRLERMALNGELELVKRSLDFIRQHNATAARPVFTARHKVWTFEGIAEKVAERRKQAEEDGPETLAEADGVRIASNPAIDRVQIFFDEKPASNLIGKLKGEGWNWSPREGAWQRKLTEAAKCSAKRIAGLL